MTLGKGDHLIKVTRYDPDRNTGTFADRVRSWAEANPTGEITERDLAQILCPNESYVIHEVMTDVHYTTRPPATDADGPHDGYSVAPGVDLKVVY